MTITCKDRLEEYLREQGVGYQLQHHPPAYTARGVAASEHVPGQEVAKTVIVIANGRTVMVVLPASYHVQLSKLASALQMSEARLANEAEFGPKFPDCEVGAMPPFGQLYGVEVYVDRTLAEDQSIVFQAGTHTDTMRIQYADFARLVHPTMVDISRRRSSTTVLR
jgi:Ala-tRNA(Pro) deacylase